MIVLSYFLNRAFGVIRRLLRFVKHTCQSLPYYFSKPISPPNGERLIYIDLDRNSFSRYFYSFIKMLHIEGYNIFIARRLMLIVDILSNKYARLLLTDHVIGIGYPKLNDTQSLTVIPKTKLSPDYFRFMIESQHKRSAVYIPMSQHPLMYRKGFWNLPINQVPRINSLFMAGNFNDKAYARIEKEAIFNVLSRSSILKQVKHIMFHVATYQDLLHYIQHDKTDKTVILVDIQHFSVPMAQLRDVITRFDFYFALPGVVMPFSHNVIEAMSVGSIPFIQNTYADLFMPPLQNEIHCITFNNSENLEEQISKLFMLPASQKDQIRQNVMAYYEKFLTPAAIGNILKNWNKDDTIYLQAEHLSVRLLQSNLNNDSKY